MDARQFRVWWGHRPRATPPLILGAERDHTPRGRTPVLAAPNPHRQSGIAWVRRQPPRARHTQCSRQPDAIPLE